MFLLSEILLYCGQDRVKIILKPSVSPIFGSFFLQYFKKRNSCINPHAHKLLILQGGESCSLSPVHSDFVSLRNIELNVQTRTELAGNKLFNEFSLEVISSKEVLLWGSTGHIRTKEEVVCQDKQWPFETVTWYENTACFLLKSILE